MQTPRCEKNKKHHNVHVTVKAKHTKSHKSHYLDIQKKKELYTKIDAQPMQNVRKCQ